MSQSTFFDTHEFIKDAVDAGFEPAAAEFLARKASEALQTDLATKTDLDALESRLQTQIVTAKFDLMKWIITALIAQAGLVVALVKLL
ncbi:MAG: DUF1640 domain-containing protein [Nitrospira sp. SB0667_bin_9]|nr:DUF1640 domain-containing protein [Nitrospira sp. SB0667_bin_9]MYD30143.1 DUF1640 domain-containing protein [Nitrospira sp. SB0661_bin_20]MYJ23042.1 DUF1640 domain-containing protein [Nitrospira sp. SB0673_bin_12]